MSKFSAQLRKLLEQNPNVLKVTEKSVAYTADFKEWALEEDQVGKAASEIFLSAGIPVDEFVEGYSRSSLKRWRKKVKDEGLKSLTSDDRGKGSTGRPKSENLEDYSYSAEQNKIIKKAIGKSIYSIKDRYTREHALYIF